MESVSSQLLVMFLNEEYVFYFSSFTFPYCEIVVHDTDLVFP